LSWSVVAAIAGIIAAIASIVAVGVSIRQLRLAQEEAELRPRLLVSLREIVYQPRPENAGWSHDKAAIVFDLTNDGRSAAHNVNCEVRLDERHFAPDDMHGSHHPYSNRHLGPTTTVPVQLNVDVLHYGSTEARYTCVCDEVGKSEGSVKFEVPEREQDEQQ
jgi:hypothetical protein